MTTGRINQVTIVAPGSAIQRSRALEELVTGHRAAPLGSSAAQGGPAVEAGPVVLENRHPLFPSIFPRAPVRYTCRPASRSTVELAGPKRRPSPASCRNSELFEHL